jgi:hypothetical protein
MPLDRDHLPKADRRCVTQALAGADLGQVLPTTGG